MTEYDTVMMIGKAMAEIGLGLVFVAFLISMWEARK
jgi:hypothetical protein